MVRRLAVASLVLATTLVGQPADAVIPSDDHEPAVGLSCTQRVAVPAPLNVIDAKWSPDSARLALTWFARLPSTRTVTGYQEEEVTDVLDLRGGMLRPLGVGDRPQWSGSGRYVSYWGPKADELRVVTDERVVARLEPTIPEVRWAGDALFFVQKDRIRSWTEGIVRDVARIPGDLVPRHPRDDVYFSADGERFTITRYSPDGAVERYVGLVETGTLAPLDDGGAAYMEWAPAGSVLLLRYPDRFVVRDLGAVTATEVPAPAGAVHAWAADGRLLLVGRVSATVPAGDALDAFRVRWPAQDGVAALPNVMGARSFSPNGRYFVGVVRESRHDGRLALYRCVPPSTAAPRADPEATARLERIAAESGRFVRPAAGDIAQFMQGSHTGVDVAAPFGSLVVAADDGVVDAAGWIPNGGDRVCVQHAGGLESCYFHLSAALVTLGERVVRGQPVALVGMTGLTTGPHVHWEAKLFGKLIDPLTR